jgi:putative oxygen-independent coproporphyrinogen III oxidase
MTDAGGPGVAPAAASAAGGALPEHVYVHVPLCVSKCAYCDFCSIATSERTADEVVAALTFQASALAPAGSGFRAKTLYLGGGTPSVLGPRLPRLVTAMRTVFGVPLEGAEVTVEANPDSMVPALAVALAPAGVTRVSLGVQSFDDAVLRVLGRAHDGNGALRAAAAVTATGALDLSIDLMCGIPGQDMRSWEESLDLAVRAGASHVSVYPLTVEPGTPMDAEVVAGVLPEPDQDLAAEMMLFAEGMLAAEGLVRYEVANFAVPGHESRHNSAYWTGRPYLALGPSAHGMLAADDAPLVGVTVPSEHADAARMRYSYTADVGAWLDAPLAPPVETEWLTGAEALREDAMLGLRLTAGIDDSLAARADVVPALESLVRDGLLEHAGGRWRVTQRGWLLGNQVFGRVWTGE